MINAQDATKLTCICQQAEYFSFTLNDGDAIVVTDGVISSTSGQTERRLARDTHTDSFDLII
jgi:F420-0:gamma-glutamyl ligase